MLFAFNCFSQHHLKKWYISPNQIDVTQIPGVTGISGATVGTDELCNGMYDPYNLNGPPMFYIAHDPLVASPFFVASYTFNPKKGEATKGSCAI